MNTNSNVYTVIYTTIIVVVVAAVLAFAAMTLKPMQDANIKAETISQMLAAAQFSSKEDLAALGNNKVLEMYSANVKEAYFINAKGEKVGDMNTEVKTIQLGDDLKAQNRNIKNGADVKLPVYVFDKDGQTVNVIPIYGAGLWGPVWGYVAFDANMNVILGAYFDHEGETPGLGAKIKDEEWFREQLKGKKADFSDEKIFDIAKGKETKDVDNAIDAITGATMTCKGLDAAINTWFAAYKPFFEAKQAAVSFCGKYCCGKCSCDGAVEGCTGDCVNCPVDSCQAKSVKCEDNCQGMCQHEGQCKKDGQCPKHAQVSNTNAK